MNLEAIYYIGQTVAVVAIILSLIFVGVQIKQNTEQTRVQNSAHLQGRFDDLWRMIGEDANLAYAFHRLNSGEKIDPPQVAQLGVFCNMMANVTWTAYIAEKQGTGTMKLAVESEGQYAEMITNPLLFSAHKRLLSVQRRTEVHGLEDDWAKSLDRDYYFAEWIDRVEKRRADIIARREAAAKLRGESVTPQEETSKEAGDA